MSPTSRDGYEELQDESESTNEIQSSSRQQLLIDDGKDQTKQSLLKMLMKKPVGLTVFTASTFLVGEVVGGGLVSIPAAIVKCGWWGIPALSIIAITACYCGILVARTWNTVKEMRQNDLELKSPFPFIGRIAFGKIGETIISIIIYLKVSSVSLIYLLLCSELLASLVTFHLPGYDQIASMRVWIVVMVAILTPLSWFGTPKDFWVLALFSSITMVLATIFIVTCYILIGQVSLMPFQTSPIDFLSFMSALGTFTFALTGATIMPTVQTDMTDPGKFSKSVVISYLASVFMYGAVGIGGFLVFGKEIMPNILNSLQLQSEYGSSSAALTYTTEVLLASHFILAFTFLINPLFQQVEKTLNIGNEFSWKRCLLRTFIVLLVFALAEIFPKFSPLLDLIGGSLNVLISFHLPTILYLKIYWDRAPVWHLLILFSVVAVATLIGGAATYQNFLTVQAVFSHIYGADHRNGTQI